MLICYGWLMKILNLLIINFFLFNFSLALEVKNFKIDNFSFETNLLDYFPKTAIDESKNCELRKGKEFCQLSIDLKKSTDIYDGVDLIFKQSNLKIHSLGGRIYFDTFEACLAEKEEATHFLTDLGGVTHLIVNEIGMYKEHPNKFNRDTIFYKTGELGVSSCYQVTDNFHKKYGYGKGKTNIYFRISLNSKEASIYNSSSSKKKYIEKN